MIRLALLLVLMLPMAARADRADFGYRQHPGAAVPGGLRMTDADGRAAPLGDLFGRVPVILDLGYFACTTLCGVARADLLHALDRSGLQAGRDYELAAISIDPAEHVADARAAKAADLARFPIPGAAAALHYLTGDAAAIQIVADAVGFRSQFNLRDKQFLHPAGLVVLTPAGVISAYLLGVGYQPGDVRAAVLRAGQFSIAQAALPVLLLCFHLDPNTGRYTLAIEQLIEIMAGLTVFMLGTTLLLLHLRDPGRHRGQGA